MIEIFIGILLLVSGRDGRRTGKGKNLLEDPEEVIVNANNDFSFEIFNNLSKYENDVLSPISILSALSILLNGARGDTLRDLQKFLKFETTKYLDKQTINRGFKVILDKCNYLNFASFMDNCNKFTPFPSLGDYELKYFESILGNSKLKEKNTNPKEYKSKKPASEFYPESEYPKKTMHVLNIANRVICSQDLKLNTDFEKTVLQNFGAEVRIAKFEDKSQKEVDEVNEWVRLKTSDKIQRIVDSIENDTLILIINVLYFKGIWEEHFRQKRTHKSDFYNNGITPVKIDMMTQTELFKYADSDELNSKVIEMDYIGGEISFVIVLPRDKNGLKTLKRKINSENFNRVIFLMYKRYTEIFVPKFKIEMDYELMDEIDPKPIALTESADLSGLATNADAPPVVSQILHKVIIEVNENGTEAAAVSAIRIVPFSLAIHYEKLTFRADHPFLYFIRDRTNGMILFSGQINKL